MSIQRVMKVRRNSRDRYKKTRSSIIQELKEKNPPMKGKESLRRDSKETVGTQEVIENNEEIERTKN